MALQTHHHLSAGKAVLIIVVVVLISALGGGWYLSDAGSRSDADQTQAPSRDVTWENSGDGWESSDTPPACPDPLLSHSPADLSLATAILYPGQTRGGDYKPHGGFRFNDHASTDITVRAPMDGRLTSASRYLEGGEEQYLLTFTHPCGYSYRLDHLLVLAPKLQATVTRLPEPRSDDSRTTRVTELIQLKAGETIATAVGFAKTRNVSFDFGLYNLRQKNSISKDPAWARLHTDDQEQAPYAVCWLDLLPSADRAIARGLPAGDGTMGKTSDYCK